MSRAFAWKSVLSLSVIKTIGQWRSLLVRKGLLQGLTFMTILSIFLVLNFDQGEAYEGRGSGGMRRGGGRGTASRSFSSASSSSGSGTWFTATAAGTRSRLIGLDGLFLSLNTTVGSVSTNSNELTISGRYGWNSGSYEYGGIGKISNASASGVTTSILGVGGFFDYNLTPNMPGVPTVLGFGGTGQLINTTIAGSSSVVTELFGGGFGKWFLFHDVCLRGDGGLLFATGGGVSKMGLKAGMSLSVYF